MLLLDEPTNHLDAESVAWLEHHLGEFPGTVVAVTHDRYFLDNVAGWILELDRGNGIPYEGNYSSWLEQKDKRLELEEKTAATPARRTMQRELEWMRQSAAGPAGQEQGAPRGLRTAGGRGAASDARRRRRSSIPPGPRLGDLVIEAERISQGLSATSCCSRTSPSSCRRAASSA